MKLKRIISPKKEAGDSWLNISMHILFCFFIVISVSAGLRFTENILFSQKSPFKETFILGPVYAAELSNATTIVTQPTEALTSLPTETQRLRLQFKNTGDVTWTSNSTFVKTSTTAFKFSHTSWQSLYFPTEMNLATVAPGQTATFEFTIKAPTYLGTYTGEFMLTHNNVMVKNGSVKITMNVVSNVVEQIAQSNPTSAPQMCTLNLKTANAIDATDNSSCIIKFGLPENGPDMRVGLLNTQESISIKNSADWEILDKDESVWGAVPAETVVNFFYSKTTGLYTFDLIDKTVRIESYLKLKNTNNGIFTVTSLNDIPSWNKSLNYNRFRGNMEIRYNEPNSRTWLIEILPLEDYVKGIKETSNPDPLEYLKTMTVAARTYALYHHNTGTKHASEFFDVDAYYDQVYKGYTVQESMPNLVTACDETKGVVGTYNSELIIAPYFSRGDGKTRSFLEVWKRAIPYLVPVLTPYTEGKTLYGHGVGIDATDARERAEHDSWTYNQLLKHYYSGISLEKIY